MATATETIIPRRGIRTRGRRFADLATRGVLVLTMICLLAALFFLLTGGQALIVRSGSMAPAIDTGDVAITRPMKPGAARVGDIVTFKDPSRSGKLVTHRVVEVQTDGAQVAFVTAGDANSGVEKWKVDSDGSIGKFLFRIPSAGYAVAWAADPKIRAALIIGAATLLAVAALRRIWGR